MYRDPDFRILITPFSLLNPPSLANQSLRSAHHLAPRQASFEYRPLHSQSHQAFNYLLIHLRPSSEPYFSQ